MDQLICAPLFPYIHYSESGYMNKGRRGQLYFQIKYNSSAMTTDSAIVSIVQ